MTRIGAFTASTLVVLAASLPATPAAQAVPGDLDPTFSGDGRQTTDFGGGGGGAQGVAVQDDGKIVAAGGSEGHFALARFLSDGSLDASFAGDGTLITDFGPGGSVAFDVAFQANGKIMAVGGAGDSALARYTADGSLDTTFGGDGTAGLGKSGYALAIQPDGKIVIAGASEGNFAVSRYNPDGSLDTTFGGGEQRVDFGAEYDAAFDVAIQRDRKIVAAGNGGREFGLARYNADGSLDASFSGDGKQTTSFHPDWDNSAYDSASGVAVQGDGKIVAAGTAGLEFGVARYDTDGSLDASFSGDGKQTTAFGSLWGETGTGVGLHSDGRIVVVGTCCWTDLGPAFGLARFNLDGSPDTTFSDDGRQGTVFDPPGSSASANDLAIQPDGNIVVAGSTSFEGGGDLALARYQGGSAPSPPGTAPTNSGPPTISGTATEGEALTVNPPGTWTGSTPMERTYQWRRCDWAGANCTDIAAATATTYTLTAADVGRTIQVLETATNAYGTGSADSAATAAVKVKPGTIAGTVKSSKKAPIAGATVNCGSAGTATTSATGAYSIANAPPGTYTCAASANGYAPKSQKVTVSSGQQTTANFSLVPR
jgi:uncharacterized delta-60 repeat protein